MLKSKILIPLSAACLAGCITDFPPEPLSYSEVVQAPRSDNDAPRALCGVNPGKVSVVSEASTIKISNRIFSTAFCCAEGKLKHINHEDMLNKIAYRGVRDPFTLGMKDGKNISSGQFRVVGEPFIERILPVSGLRAADALPGYKVTFHLRHAEHQIEAVFSAIMLDETNYIRYTLDIVPKKESLTLNKVELLSFVAPKVQQGGVVEGTPAVTETLFAGLEHPMSVNKIQSDWQDAGAFNVPDLVKGHLEEVTFKMPEKAMLAGKVEIRIVNMTPEENVYIQDVRLYDGDETVGVLPERRTLRGLDKSEPFRVELINRNEGLYEFTLPSDLKNPVLKINAEMFTYKRDMSAKNSYEFKVMTNRPPEMHRRVTCTNPNPVTIDPGKTYHNTSVIGICQPGQLRRAFNYYLELERAHPYRQFLHYNSWYDIGYFSRFNEKECLDVVNAYCHELGEARGVMPKSFLLDDGWDNTQSLWEFDKGFPSGFTAVAELTQKYGSSIGVWLSPWGGYGKPKEERLKAAEGKGYETNDQGFALSGKKYFARFKEICSEMITKYNVGMFKFDGLGRTGKAENSDFNTDFEASIALIDHLRGLRKDLLVNLTTGTWASPFWVRIADTIWRGGTDHEFMGKGSDRQRWMTYRDQDTYEGIVQGCKLFPINSLMIHGLIFAKHAYWLDYDPNGDFRQEVRSFFGGGTMLQEMYVTPALMNNDRWNTIAEAAKWANRNSDVMYDMHWIGGCPVQLQVYGWAAWLPGKGVMTLRNPNDIPQKYILDVNYDLELPSSAPESFDFKTPYPDQRVQSFTARNGGLVEIELQPFEVLVFDIR